MIDTSEATDQLCRRLVHALAEPFEVEGHSVRIGASIGVAVTPSDATDPSSLMRLADQALYRAKAAGWGTFRRHEANPDQAASEAGKLGAATPHLGAVPAPTR